MSGLSMVTTPLKVTKILNQIGYNFETMGVQGAYETAATARIGVRPFLLSNLRYPPHPPK